MRKLLMVALIVPVALLGAARPAKASNEIGAVLTGVAVGISAALILDALTPPAVAAAPAVVYPPAPVVVRTPPPVVYQPAPVVVYRPAPVIVYTPPPVIVTPAPVVYHAPRPVVHYRPGPLVVRPPRHVIHEPALAHPHGHRGKGHGKHASYHDH
jgi:hypothetical protein